MNSGESRILKFCPEPVNSSEGQDDALHSKVVASTHSNRIWWFHSIVSNKTKGTLNGFSDSYGKTRSHYGRARRRHRPRNHGGHAPHPQRGRSGTRYRNHR